MGTSDGRERCPHCGMQGCIDRVGEDDWYADDGPHMAEWSWRCCRCGGEWRTLYEMRRVGVELGKPPAGEEG